MNILFIGSLTYPPRSPLSLDGGVRRMLPLLKHIQKKGHKVIMVIPTLKSSEYYEVYDGFPVYQLGPNNWGPLKLVPYFTGISLVLETFNKLRKLVSTYGIDVIHVFNPTLICGIPGWLIGQVCHRPWVLEFSDLVINFGIDTGQMSPKSLVTKMGFFVQNNLPFRADMVIATNFIGKMLETKGMPSEKISVIPCGVNSSMFYPEIDARKIKEKYRLGDSIVILYQGLVCKAYGTDTLLEAMSKVSHRNEKVKLLIVGFHRNRERVEFEQDEEIIAFKEKTALLGIEDKVIFTGPQPPETIPNFIAAADICVNPMPYTLTCRAGSPIKVFEYMAVAKPVVATALDSVEGVIIDGETGVIAKPDAENIAEKILWLVENPSIRDKIGRNAREKVVAEYEWEKLGDRLINAYRQAIENLGK
jgi:glycosyltransferase involved in cell wall biosynthesis